MFRNTIQRVYHLIFADNTRMEMVSESNKLKESILKIERQTSLDHELIKSDLIKAQEDKSEEITKQLNEEIKTVKKRTDDVSLRVEKSILKLEQLSSFDENALKTELKKQMEIINSEVTSQLDNNINTITKRVDNVSSDLLASSIKLDKLMAFDHNEATLEMTKLIEKKTKEVLKDLKSEMNKETKPLRDSVEDIQKWNQQSDETKKLLDEIKDEHQRLSKF